MAKEQECPCCGQKIELLAGDRFESHIPIVPAGRDLPKRAGIWCDSSGYTAEQTKRWMALPEAEQRKLLAARSMCEPAVA